ncbi:MAG: helix-turn-helix transcriptional regulator [Clostridia bacterium]|nr:helix-turn-helix transcriptional regulator [Clostridia bacterium]
MELITCNECGIATCHEKGFSYTRTEYSGYFLIMFFKSPFVYKSGDEIRRSEKNRYLIYTPDSSMYHSDDGSTGTGFVNDWIFVRGEVCEDIVERFSLPLNKAFYMDNFGILETYIEKIINEMVMKNNCYEYKVDALIVDMLISMGRLWELTEKNNHSAYNDINNARNHMLSNCHEKISLEQLSQMTGYSQSRFCVLYSSFFGSTPIDDLLNARIEKAKGMLSYSNMTVTEVAEKCGFSSVHYFSRKFKEITGVSTTKYKL